MPYAAGSSKLLIYFHANAEDIVLSHELLDCLRYMLKVNVLSIEYPGYGIYTEEHQKRYKYPFKLTESLRRKYRHVDQAFKRVSQRNISKNDFDSELDMTSYDAGFGCSASCEPSLAQMIKAAEMGEGFDPYEPYNEHVFEPCEENILDDSTYVFDYL